MKLKVTLKLLISLLLVLVLVGCTDKVEPKEETNDKINYLKIENEIGVGESFILNAYVGLTAVYYESSNTDVIMIKSRVGYAISAGFAKITARSYRDDSVVKTMFIRVTDFVTEIKITNFRDIEVGETIKLGYETIPSNNSASLSFTSSDENVATITKDGTLTGVSSGFTRITLAVDNKDINDEVLIYVKEKTTSPNDTISNEHQNVTKTIDISTLKDVFEPVIQKGYSFTVGVNSYQKKGSSISKLSEASGVIYKRYCVKSDGTEVEDSGDITDFTSYKYYVITCKHILDGAYSVEVTYDGVTLEAETIAYDTKIDLGVITFYDYRYIPTATFGDSTEVEAGEFVIAVGSIYGKDYPNSVTTGIVSYNGRYVSTDTDNDGTNDWDSLYIQHDVAIGEGSSGGALINMKGEVIGINSVKISSDKIDNMGFAIPSNLVDELCSQLMEGIIPVRPLFHISILSVLDILKNDYLLQEYPVPDEIKYGMYIAEVDPGGVGDLCGMKAGDIIVEFNGLKIAYSYELRAAMGQVIVGSNEEINVVVYRNGEYITLKAVF